MKPQTQVLLAGVDTLIINARYPLKLKEEQPPIETEPTSDEQEQDGRSPQEKHLLSLLAQLAAWSDQAKADSEPVATDWEHLTGVKLMIQTHGTPTYDYVLKDGAIDLLMGPRLKNGAMARVRFSSEYLWKRGVDQALMHTHLFLSTLFNEVLELQPAEIHICADVTGLVIPHNYERVFVSHAAKWRPIKQSNLDKPVYTHHKLETLQFSGHGNPVSMTIYNKPAEIEQKSKTKRWFYNLWKERGNWDGRLPEKTRKKDKYGLPVYDTSLTVWRIECRIKREALHDMDIEDAYQAIDLVPSLWAYCVGKPGTREGWTRMITPNIRDTNRARWPASPGWEVIQKAFQTNWRDGSDIHDLQREWKGQINIDQAEKAMAGYLTTYSAWLKGTLPEHADVSLVMHRLFERIQNHWDSQGKDFETLRKEKELRYHIPQEGETPDDQQPA